MIYFDNAATTPLSPSVITVMTETMTDVFGNPSSIHSYGRQASKTLRESRQTIANLLDVNARHIIFTSGGQKATIQLLKAMPWLIKIRVSTSSQLLLSTILFFTLWPILKSDLDSR